MNRRLNVRFLVALLTVTAGAGAAVHTLHGRGLRRSVAAYLARADEAERTGRLDEAARQLEQYVSREPEDLRAAVRLGLILGRDPTLASTPDLDRAAKLLNFAIVRDPKAFPRDARVRLARVEMELGRFGQARAHLAVILEATPRDVEARILLGRSLEALGDYEGAARAFDEARRDDPSRVEAYERLARLRRVKLRDPRGGDAAMDAGPEPAGGLVATNPRLAAAYVARGRYRREFGLPGSEDDAARAVAIGPDDVNALLLAAEVAATVRPEPDLEAARAHLDRATRVAPDDPRVYKASADVEVAGRDVDAAIRSLERGAGRLPDNLFLRWLLADLLIRAGRLDDAPGRIAALERGGVDRALTDYLHAQLAYRRGLWAEASGRLEASAQELGARTGFEDLAKRTYLTLGDCFERLGNLDQRYLAFRRAVGIVPTGTDRLAVPARTGLAASLVALGRVDDAIEEYRKNLLLPEVREDVGVVLARLLIFRNLRLPEPRRRWDEVEALLESSGRSRPGSTEVVVLRAEALAARGQFDPARKLLEEARDRHPDEVELWVALSVLAVRQERVAEAMPILDEAEARLGDRLEIRLARARFWGGRGGPAASSALKQLVQGADGFGPVERLRLVNAVAEAHLRLGEVRDAVALWQDLARLQPNNLHVRLLIFDAAAWADDQPAMARTLDEVRAIEGEAGSIWRYGRARMLIRAAPEGESAGLVEARLLLNAVAARRPAWSRVPLSIGEIDDRLGNVEAALRGYRRALELGDRSPTAIRRTVQILHRFRRFDQADQVLRRLQEEMPISSDLQKLAADISLQTHDYGRALDLARHAVTTESADHRDHVWLGQLLWAVSRRDDAEGRKDQGRARRAEAERALRRATTLAPGSPESWVVLIQYLAETGNVEAAGRAIADAEKAIPPELSALPMALANDSIGRVGRAEVLYRRALEDRPDDLPSIRGLAGFLVKFDRIEEAKPLLGRLIALKAQSLEDASWAQRILAIALSLEGREQVALRALDILDVPEDPAAPGAGEGDVDDLRARAHVFATQRNRDRRREAIRLLEAVHFRRSSTPGDRFILAQLHEAEGDWAKAREHLQSILVEEPSHGLALAAFARGLIRRGLVEEARPWVEKLEKAHPVSPSLVELKARIAARDGQPSRAAEIVVALADAHDEQLADCAGLLEDLGLFEPAEGLYRRLAARPGEPGQALTLAAFLARRGRPGDALAICAEAWTTLPARDVSQASVNVLFASGASADDCREVAGRIESALASTPDDPSLAFDLANVRILQGRPAEAEKIFRDAAGRDPNNPAPLNNLAWLLANEPGRVDEALRIVDRAIALAGAVPELLDTRGMIHLASGRVDLAVKELEDSVAVAPSADNNFHLARAYLASRRPRDAADALRESRHLGLRPDTLHPAEREAYRRLAEAIDGPGG